MQTSLIIIHYSSYTSRESTRMVYIDAAGNKLGRVSTDDGSKARETDQL